MKQTILSDGLILVRDIAPKKSSEIVTPDVATSLCGSVCPGSTLPSPPGTSSSLVVRQVTLRGIHHEPAILEDPSFSLIQHSFANIFQEAFQIVGVTVTLTSQPHRLSSVGRAFTTLPPSLMTPPPLQPTPWHTRHWGGFNEAFILLSIYPLEEVTLDLRDHNSAGPALFISTGTPVQFSFLNTLNFSCTGLDALVLLKNFSLPALSALSLEITSSASVALFWDVVLLSLAQGLLLKDLAISLRAIHDTRGFRLVDLISRLPTPNISLKRLSLQPPALFNFELVDICKILELLPKLRALILLPHKRVRFSDGVPRFGGKREVQRRLRTLNSNPRGVVLSLKKLDFYGYTPSIGSMVLPLTVGLKNGKVCTLAKLDGFSFPSQASFKSGRA